MKCYYQSLLSSFSLIFRHRMIRPRWPKLQTIFLKMSHNGHRVVVFPLVVEWVFDSLLVILGRSEIPASAYGQNARRSIGSFLPCLMSPISVSTA